MASKKKYISITFSFEESDTQINTLSNFMMNISEAAAEFNDNKPYTASTRYNLCGVKVTDSYDENEEVKSDIKDNDDTRKKLKKR